MRFTGSLSELENVDIELIGVPFDGNASFRRGSNSAPDAIRKASFELETFLWNRKIEITDFGYYDHGDLTVDIYEDLFDLVKRFKSDNRIFLGGDHSISLPIVKSLGDVTVVSIDSHADFRDEYQGNRFSNACVMRRISEVIGTENLIEIGICSSSEDEYRAIMKDEIEVYDLYTLREEGIDCVVDRLPSDDIHLSIDIDSLDLASGCGVGNPEPDGLSIPGLIGLVGKIVDEREVVACDIVEVNPDFGDTTSFVAARIVMEIIGGWSR
ncbi:MAG: arginase family protein [Halobacteriota archaeon]|nr:arginase family protein [Halobacteriota archaeon]